MLTLTRLKLILRNWKRNNIFSITAILSLIIGFACCNLLVAFVVNEWKISEGSPDKNRIFVLETDNPMTLESTKEKSSFILSKVPPMLKERYPEVNSYCRFQNAGENPVFKSDDFITRKLTFLHADKNINEFFNIPLIAGDLAVTLSNPGEAAITASWAKKVYGNTDVLDRTFYYSTENGKALKKITSVIDDSYTSSFITFNVLLPLDEESYFGGVTFLKLKDLQSQGTLLQKMEDDFDVLPRLTKDCKYYLQSLTDYYFSKSETQSSWGFLLKRDRLFVYIGIISALAILFVACFNFINLYLVRLFKSGTSNTIQKILGASSQQLQKQILLESFLATLIGFLVSILLMLALLPGFNSFFDAHLSPSFLLDKTVLAFYIVLIAVLTIIPSVFLGIKFRKNAIGNFSIKNIQSKAVFSNTMISLQFGFSILLIVAAFLFSRQLNFISETANIKPNLIEIDGSGISGSKFQTFKNQVTNLSSVEASTISGTGFLNAWIALGNDDASIITYQMDNDFLKTHNIFLKDGKGFTVGVSGKIKQAIVNETLVRKYKIENPVGKTFSILGKEITIVGVVKDFYSEQFSAQVKPTMITPINLNQMNFMQKLQVKLVDGTRQTSITDLENIWKDKFPDKIFNYSFLSDDFQMLHKDYKQLAEMVYCFTIISLLLAGFGLFGVAWYSVERRTKEIGVRKVNGAKITEILALLNKDFLKWVVIAFVVACPIAWYAMTRWLENFAYKTKISWWVFAMAGAISLVIAMVTVSFQSYRAARRNPVEALRYE